MNKITLCCTSLNLNHQQLIDMLHSAVGFDKVILHINGEKSPILLYPLNIRQIWCTDNLSAAQGFNYTINNVDTEWICPFADDDFFHTENLKELLTWFHNTNITEDIIHFPCYTGNDQIDWRIWGYKSVTYEGLRKQNMLPFSCFYRKSLWEKVGGYDNFPFNDWGFWLKALKIGATIKYWDNPIYYFRQGIEERLSDKERHAETFEDIRSRLLKRADEL